MGASADYQPIPKARPNGHVRMAGSPHSDTACDICADSEVSVRCHPLLHRLACSESAGLPLTILATCSTLLSTRSRAEPSARIHVCSSPLRRAPSPFASTTQMQRSPTTMASTSQVNSLVVNCALPKRPSYQVGRAEDNRASFARRGLRPRRQG